MKVRSQCHIFVNIADETKRGGGKCYAWISFFEHVLLGEINEKLTIAMCMKHALMGLKPLT
jgi:hypothetical protein